MKLMDYFDSVIEAKGLKYKEVSERIGCDRAYIYAVKSGKRNIGETMFKRLCSALELDEDEVRNAYGDQIAPRGYNHKNDSPKKQNADRMPKLSKRMNKREENDPAELLINMMHLFVCELNDSGKRVTMSVMQMLRDIDAFKINYNIKENEHEETENADQD